MDAAIEFLDDLNITNEMMRVHVVGLCVDKELASALDQVETKVKGAFTREYNKGHQAIKRVGKAGKVKEEEKKENDEEEEEEESDQEEEEQVLLDEEEIKEIKAAKQREKADRKAAAAMKRLTKGQGLTMVSMVPNNKSKPAAKTAQPKKAAKAAKEKKGAKTK